MGGGAAVIIHHADVDQLRIGQIHFAAGNWNAEIQFDAPMDIGIFPPLGLTLFRRFGFGGHRIGTTHYHQFVTGYFFRAKTVGNVFYQFRSSGILIG